MDQATSLREMVENLSTKRLVLIANDSESAFTSQLSREAVRSDRHVLVVSEAPAPLISQSGGLGSLDDPITTDSHGVLHLTIDKASEFLVEQIDALKVIADVILFECDPLAPENHLPVKFCNEVVVVSSLNHRDVISAYSLIRQLDRDVLEKVTFLINNVGSRDEAENAMQNIREIISEKNVKSLEYTLEESGCAAFLKKLLA